MNERTSSRVPHSKRPCAAGPLHVSMHLKDGLPPLRNQRTLRILLPAIRAAKNRFGVRICHWSILSNHLHLLVDSNSEQCLAKAMQGFKIRVAKALNVKALAAALLPV